LLADTAFGMQGKVHIGIRNHYFLLVYLFFCVLKKTISKGFTMRIQKETKIQFGGAQTMMHITNTMKVYSLKNYKMLVLKKLICN